ncbi:MAG TPA: restriction endonuclease subunit S [Terracidiphilus sp.]|nr:restriction endonuclease subunit S [Terracidiphilus sp.]
MLQILYSKPYAVGLSLKQVKALAAVIEKPADGAPRATPDQIWRAYQRIDGSHVRGSKTEPAPPSTGDLPDLPEGWCWASAEQTCKFITKGTTPSADRMEENCGDVPFLKVYNLTFSGKLDFSINPTFVDRSTHEGFLSRSRVFPGDVLMNIVGPRLGKVSVVPESYAEWNVNQAIAIFRPLPGFSRWFLAARLMSSDLLAWAMSKAKATTGQFNLTLEICRDLPIPLPPEKEQARITDEIDRQLTYLENAENLGQSAVNRQDRLRRSILCAAFSGDLVPQDPTDEPASVLLERIRAERAASVKQTPKRSKRGRREDALVPAQ